MNKFIYAFIFILAIFSACKNDVNEGADNNQGVSSVKTNNEEPTKRVLKATRVITPEEKAKKEANQKSIIKEKAQKERDLLYEKNKKIRANEKQNRKEESDGTEMIDMGNGVKIAKHYNFASYDLPDACDLLSADWIATNFKTNSEDITIKNSSSARTRYARSCFFKWEIESVANGGIMLQIQKNPVPEITQTWVKGFLDSKRKEGESMMDSPDIVMTYKDLPGLGDEAVYNFGLNRCYWRVGEDQLFMLAFNLGLSEIEEKAMALKLGNEISENFKKIKK